MRRHRVSVMFQCCMRPWAQSSVGPSLCDPWDRRIVFRVKTKQKTAQTRPGPAEAIHTLRALPGPRLCIGAPRVQFLAFMWPHRAMSQARAPVAHIASALHGRRLIPSAEDAPQTRPCAARKSRGTQTMRDRKRCGIEHACACAEQWQANQTKRPLPPKGDDDHMMICSTQSRGTQEARDSKEVSSTQSRGTQEARYSKR